eukprot:3641724-Prymnesium_polylepis.1
MKLRPQEIALPGAKVICQQAGSASSCRPPWIFQRLEKSLSPPINPSSHSAPSPVVSRSEAAEREAVPM